MSKYAVCPECGYRMKEIEPGTYSCVHCKGESEEGCERITVSEAAFLWNLNARREDILFGYSVEELEIECDRSV
ncbi:MAG: hypothetical protein K5891_06870 [Lachnospiraceae bacterium]|nr:hypothetical protein [Lachnospiraceae bacterium]